MKPKIYEVEIERSSNHLVIRKVGKSKSVSTMLTTILLLAIAVASALLFAFLVSKGLIIVTSVRTPSVLLVASSDKWDNITQLELRSQAGETLKTQDLGLRIEGWMENSQGGRQYVRFYIPSLSTQRQAVQAESYQYDWGRILYVWCLESSVGMASSLHVMMEGNGENVRFVSFTRINLVHSPSRSLIFSAGTPLTVFLRVLPPIYPGAPGTSIENLWIENTLLTTNPNPPAPLTADQLFLRLGSGSGKIYLGYGTRWSTYVATSIYDNGKLGIGITSPSARLHVRGDNVLFENASGSVGFYMDAQSRVGIGTTTPAYLLDVAGTIRAKDVFAAGGFNLIIGDDAYLTDIDTANTLGIYGLQDSSVGAIKLGSNGGTIYGYNGNIGIGVSNPGYNLSVGGSVGVEVQGREFLLGTNDGRNRGAATGQRALVHADWSPYSGAGTGDWLYVNYNGDFDNGVIIYPGRPPSGSFAPWIFGPKAIGKVFVVASRNEETCAAFYKDGPINWTNVDPGATDEYDICIYGWLKPKTAEAYTFTIYHDDGAGFIFYDHVKDTFYCGHNTGTTAFTVTTGTLDPNQWYMFFINNEEEGTTQFIRLTWKTATIAEEDVPASNLAAPSGSLFWFLIQNGGSN